MIEEIRDIGASLWISASAGTGKTKSLVDRLLALLLNGVNPSKILCLTYTRTAATEMLERLARQLQDFRRMSDDELRATLENTGFDERHLPIARSLHEKSMLPSEWVQIKTIHGFCSWILQKFPLETGMHSGMSICDDHQKKLLLNAAVGKVFEDENCRDSLELISGHILDLSAFIENNLSKITKFTAQFDDFEQLYADFFNIKQDKILLNEKELTSHLMDEIFSGQAKKIFLELSEILFSGSAKDIEKATCLKIAAENLSDDFLGAFLTKKLEALEKKCSEALAKKYPFLPHRMEEVAQLAMEFLEAKRKHMSAKMNAAFFLVAKKIIMEFNELKRKNYCVDFNDLIWNTSILLKDMQWVLYKIDGGLDHLLIDEAQDTSPEQWEIVGTIVDEFFANYGSRKTVFVVGDEKQSIYSFQGADLEQFRQMHGYFRKISEFSGQKFHNLALNTSYRSTGNILSFVDGVFKDIFPNTSHVPHRSINDGVVEIVELFEDDDSEEDATDDVWEIAGTASMVTAEEKLASHIANLIHDAISSGVFVASKGRPATASDFLILFQHREPKTMRLILRALGNFGIPTSGVDRFLLKDELIVEDLMIFAEFAVFPQDDLACARVLRSPVVGMDESELMDLCIARKDAHLWDYLLENEKLCLRYSLDKLKAHLYDVFRVPVYDFFMSLLTDDLLKHFVARLGQQCLDALREFLEIVQDNNMAVSAFCDWFRSCDYEIKRESFGGECVKLMTVHGAKGLQAPFVIIADSHFFRENDNKILKTPDGIFVWDFSRKFRSENLTELCSQESRRNAEESHRLLYVALTRAQDFLYILGKNPKKNLRNSCWYSIVSRANNRRDCLQKAEIV
ncbi:MAG: UvrD-helicase domain-containing protein [Holosporaceae bacterium]|jgi:ATP-dependent helicase/nuclease subunit A|nr:UvrD-helicase domain-containing protein [Holosporaceae bacterium]